MTDSTTVGEWIVDHPDGTTSRHPSERAAHKSGSIYGALRMYKATR